ncbi:hypothetical protein ACFL0W_03995 [Nanoarchaeota archaeon]
MKKPLLSILAILMTAMLIFVSGCGEEDAGTGTSGAGGAGGTAAGAFASSSNDGFAITFVSGAPPPIVYDDNFEFDINLRVENMGEFESDPDYVKITGISPTDFGITAEDLKQDPAVLAAVRKDPAGNIIQGELTNLEFEGLDPVAVSGNVMFNLQAEICYPYETTSITSICILEDILGTGKPIESAICNPNSDRTTEVSGGPVEIVNFRESAIGKDKISFSFDVQHRGSGVLFKEGVEGDNPCKETLANKDKVTVTVDSETKLPGDLSCSGLDGNAGELTLFRGEEGAGTASRTIVCSLSLPSEGRTDYETPITIKVGYQYKQASQTKQIEVKHIEPDE